MSCAGAVVLQNAKTADAARHPIAWRVGALVQVRVDFVLPPGKAEPEAKLGKAAQPPSPLPLLPPQPAPERGYSALLRVKGFETLRYMLHDFAELHQTLCRQQQQQQQYQQQKAATEAGSPLEDTAAGERNCSHGHAVLLMVDGKLRRQTNGGDSVEVIA